MVGAAQGVEVEVMGGRQVAAEVVLVAAAGVEDDRAFRRVGVFDELLRVGGGDDADVGEAQDWAASEQCGGGEELEEVRGFDVRECAYAHPTHISRQVTVAVASGISAFIAHAFR